MFNLGGGEILVILIVALLVLGPDKLPKFMRTVGRAVGDLRRASTDFQRSMNLEIAENEAAAQKTKPESPDLRDDRENTGEQGENTAGATSAPEAPLPSRPTPKLRATPSRRGSRPIVRR